MIDEDQLKDLATLSTPTLIRPLSEITARARVLRRRRRFAAGAVTSLAVVGVTATMMGFPNIGHQDRTASSLVPAVSAAETLKNCYPGSTVSTPVSPAKVPQALFLPPTALTGPPLTPPRIDMHSKMTCQAPASAMTWVSLTAGQVERAVHLEGPDRGDPTSLGQTFPMDGDKPQIIDVNGSEGTLYYSTPDRLGTMFWDAADGSTWTAEVSGMSQDDALAAVRNVTIVGDKILETASPGIGFTAIDAFEGRLHRGGAWVVSMYGPSQGHAWLLTTFDFSGQTLNVTAGARQVDINGTPGWVIKDSDGTRLNWEVSSGIRASISGELSVSEAVKLAQATVPVPPNDPRWSE